VLRRQIGDRSDLLNCGHDRTATGRFLRHELPRNGWSGVRSPSIGRRADICSSFTLHDKGYH
jgi:hypothetical protein